MKFRNWAILMVVVPVLLTAGLLAAFFVGNRLSSLEGDLRERGQAMARQVAAGSELGLFSGNRPMLESVAAAAMRDRQVDAVIVRNEAGVVMVRLGDERAAAAAVGGAANSGYVIAREPVRRPVTPLDDLFSVAAPSPEGDLGSVVVVMATEPLRKAQTDAILAALAVAGGLSIAGVGVVLFFLRRFGLRLVQLSEVVGRIGEGNLVSEVSNPLRGGRLRVRELDLLASGIDVMARQIGASHRDLAQRVAEATVELERRRADAERANNAKSRFLAAASHDLRQPLHALGLFADQLARRPLAGEDARLVTRIVESTGALSELLDSLLDISRLDAGALVPKMTAIELAPMLDRMQAEFAAQAEHAGLRFHVHGSDAWVSADAMMLERILINLVSNAIRYTSAGTIFLAVRRGGRGKIRIEVRDSGAGIPEDAQRLIFDEFVQLGNPERDRSKGLGLGLSIVQRMCQLMNCRFGVRSRFGGGSVFWIELARIEPVLASGLDPVATDRRMAGRFVVVIEDDPLARDSVCDQLRSWGCEVCTANSGDELLAALAARTVPPDAILCDHRLQSGERGEDLIMRVRAQTGIRVPAVLVTGDSALQLRGNPAVGELPVLSKPVRPARLRAVLQGIFPTGEN